MTGTSRRRAGGMTLIELLIVFTIIGLLVSLVAPSSTKIMDKARAQEEWLVLDRTVDSLAFKAYADARFIQIDAQESTLQWTISGKAAGVLSLSHLRFDKPQQVVISPNGLANADRISVLQGERLRSLRLNRWIRKGT